MSEYSVFKPRSSRSMFVDYPELRKFRAFDGLREDDILFVWFFACESSPLNTAKKDLTHQEKVEKAVKLSYNRREGMSKITKIEVGNMIDERFPPKISAAIEQMEKFRVGPRIRAKQMTENAFNNLEKILNIDVSEEEDMTKQKAYVDIVEKGLKIMPKIVESIEGGYRLTEEKEDEELSIEGISPIDSYHDQED